MHKIEEIKDLKTRLMSVANMAMDNCDKVETSEMGDLVDMIKDLAEAEEKCMKAKYYEAVICAMEKAEGDFGMDPEDMEMMLQGMAMDHMRRGFNPNRSASTGRFTSNRGRGSGNRSNSSSSMSGSRGYNPGDDDYPDMGNDDQRTNTERFGRPYNEYRLYRRNYTESKSKTDKMEMDKHAKEHIDDAVSTMKDIWNNSDPDLRKKMKSDITSLLAEMN